MTLRTHMQRTTMPLAVKTSIAAFNKASLLSQVHGTWLKKALNGLAAFKPNSEGVFGAAATSSALTSSLDSLKLRERLRDGLILPASAPVSIACAIPQKNAL